MKKIKLISLSLLALSPFVSAEENVSQKILIKSMIGGTGWSWNPKERDYDKGAYLRLDTANIFEGKCFSFDRNGKKYYRDKAVRSVYLQGFDGQVAAFVPIFDKAIKEQEYIEITYKPVECQADTKGVLFSGYQVSEDKV